MLDFCSTGKPHYKVPHYNVVFNIHVTCQYNKLSLIVCDYGPQRQKYTTWLTCTFYEALLKIGSQNQKLCSLHEKCRSVGQNQRNFILTDKIFILSDNSPTKIIIITMITYRSAKIGFCPATKCSLPDSCHAANKKISRRLAICINLNLNPRLLYLESNTTFYHFATMLPEIQKTFILKANDF